MNISRLAVFSLILLLAGCGTAVMPQVRTQITWGWADGNRHPFVGAMVAEWRTAGQKELLCSGALISPTVFLTAAHCTAFLQSKGIEDVWVTFVSEYDSSNPSGLHHGTMHTNPGYTFRQDDPGDIAVIVLDKKVKRITPAQLPMAGLLDQMSRTNGLLGQKFTAVGYGVQEPQFGGGPPAFPFTGARMYSVSQFLSLEAAWLTLSQNKRTGDGGTCYGDSGGPNFLGAWPNETTTPPTIAAITVTGDAMCLATNKTYRVDTPAARAFLEEFVTLP